jgi:hypothetical protein
MTQPSTTPPASAAPAPHRNLAAIIIGCLLLVPGLALLLGGGGIAVAHAFARDDAGFYSFSLNSLRSPTVAITAKDVVIQGQQDVPRWLLDRLDVDVRVTARPVTADRAIFLGFGPANAVNSYLSGAAHDQITDVSDNGVPTYRTAPGSDTIAPPTEQTFWTANASGTGQQELSWTPASGSWDAVLMNADGSPGVDATATVGVRAGFLLPMSLIMMALGLLLIGAGVLLIVRGASPSQSYRSTGSGTSGLAGMEGPSGAPVGGASVPVGYPRAPSPVALNAHLDDGLSRWLWLVKWLLAIPHFFVLALLWCAFLVVSVIAFFAILLTGTYPRGLFDFNLGVLRWSWRVAYYCANGGIGTDHYPPFSLSAEPDYPATLDIAYPERLSRGLVLVKWWLLAIPHYLIVALLVGGGWGWTSSNSDGSRFDPVGGGILGLLVVVAGVFLLFSSRYPAALFALIIGLNRWVYRVIAYAALMTDVYPPFQLDEGGLENPLPAPPPPSAGDAGSAAAPLPRPTATLT